MKVIEGKLVTLIELEAEESVAEHHAYLDTHPNLNLFATDNFRSNRTLYYYTDVTINVAGKLRLRINKRFMLIFDPIYGKVKIRLPNDPYIYNYLEVVKECIDLFKENKVEILYLPEIEGGEIGVYDLEESGVLERAQLLTGIVERILKESITESLSREGEVMVHVPQVYFNQLKALYEKGYKLYGTPETKF